MSRARHSEPDDQTGGNDSLTAEGREAFERLKDRYDDDHDVAKIATVVLQSDKESNNS